jgi:phage baseplate assembly protein W
MNGPRPSCLMAILVGTVMLVTSDLQWQPVLGSPGELVYGDDELEQSLLIVLKTVMGSVPGRPEFGSKLLDFIDEPVTTVAPGIVREVFRAVKASEPRITVLAATPLSAEPGTVETEVRWKPTNGGATRSTRVKVGS